MVRSFIQTQRKRIINTLNTHKTMHTLTFTLKQHTPLIHFQHAQDGATLRATEVKPKLDRFLIKKCQLTEYIEFEGKQKEIPKEEYAHMFINSGRQHLALDYKLSFNCAPNTTIVIEKKSKNSLPLFFGNMGDDYIEKGLVMSINKHLIACKIQSFKCLDIIISHLADFFFENNFGTRQSKGFGSFFIEDDMLLNSKKINYKKAFSSLYKFSVALPNGIKEQVDKNIYVFYVIDTFYRSIRQGINEKKGGEYNDFEYNSNTGKLLTSDSSFYIKPAVFLYAKSREHQWDKKTIKQKFYNNDYLDRWPTTKEKDEYSLSNSEKIFELGLKQQIKKYESPDTLTFESTNDINAFYDYKDVFGLSSRESWKSYGDTVSKVVSNDIQRFKSPITFKPVWRNDNVVDVHIFLSNIEPAFLKANITVKSKSKSRLGDITMKVPQFTMSDFFEFILNKDNYDIETLVDNQSYRGYTKKLSNLAGNAITNEYSYFKTLQSVYQSLRDNHQTEASHQL